MTGKYVGLKRAVFSKPMIFSVASRWRAVLQAVIVLVALGSAAVTPEGSVLGTWCSSSRGQYAPPVALGKRFHNDGGHLIDATTSRQMVGVRGKQGALWFL